MPVLFEYDNVVFITVFCVYMCNTTSFFILTRLDRVIYIGILSSLSEMSRYLFR